VKPKEKKIKKEKTTEYETINAPTISSATTPAVTAPSTSVERTDPGLSSESDEEVPELTPTLLEFSKIEISTSEPAAVFQKSFEFIQAHPDVYVEGAVDALFLAAFTSQLKAAKGKGSQAKKDARYALQCVHQGLLIQYCEKLGKDGVRMFFRK
jgi:cell division cycle protein 37